MKGFPNESARSHSAKLLIHKTPAGLLDHHSPTAEGLSCDCTYQFKS